MSLDFVTVEDNQFTVLDDDLYPWALKKLKSLQSNLELAQTLMLISGHNLYLSDVNIDLGYVPYKKAYQLLPEEQVQRNQVLKACRNLFFDELHNEYGKQSRLVVINTKDYKWKDTQ